MTEIYTIGVYGSTEDAFFRKLTGNGIDLFCDIRQRRGVRGSLYKFVNSSYLQSKLKELGIAYRYIKGLAPTKEIRSKQIEADKALGETKKQRTALGNVFKAEYTSRILDCYDINGLADELKAGGANRIALFCVEQHAGACHRSLVAERLADIFDSEIVNL